MAQARNINGWEIYGENSDGTGYLHGFKDPPIKHLSNARGKHSTHTVREAGQHFDQVSKINISNEGQTDTRYHEPPPVALKSYSAMDN